MKKFGKLFIVFLVALTLVGCSEKTKTIDEVFADHVGETYVLPIEFTDAEKQEMGIVEYIYGHKFIKYVDENTLELMSFYGEDDTPATFEYFNDGSSLLYKNEYKTVKPSEYFTVIGATDYFTTSFKEDEGVSSYAFIYWFNTSSDKVTLERSMLMDLMEERKGLGEYYDYSDVKKELAKKTPASETGKLDAYYQASAKFDYDAQRTRFKNAQVKKTFYTFNETFVFDKLSITFTGVNTWTAVSNRFSEHNNKDVFYLDVKVRNNSSTPNNINMFAYTIYGPDYYSIDGVSAYFDGSSDYSEKILAGQEVTTFIPVLYKGDGIYTILFELGGEAVLFAANVKKP